MDKWLIRTPRQGTNVTQTRRSHSSATGSTDSDHGDRFILLLCVKCVSEMARLILNDL